MARPESNTEKSWDAANQPMRLRDLLDELFVRLDILNSEINEFVEVLTPYTASHGSEQGVDELSPATVEYYASPTAEVVSKANKELYRQITLLRDLKHIID